MNSPTLAAPAASTDRRTAERRPLRVQAMVALPGQQRFAVRTLDVGPGGLGLVAAANPKPGTIFDVEFALPAKSRSAVPVKVSVRVIHSVFSSAEDGFKIGLSFVRLPPEAAQAIATFMK